MVEKYISLRIIALTIILAPMGIVMPKAHAGGYDAPFNIVSFTAENTDLSARVVLEPLDNSDGYFSFNCPRVTIHIKYKPEPSYRQTWSESLVTEQTHREALNLLAERGADHGEVFFGMFGSNGLPAAKNSRLSRFFKGIARTLGFRTRRAERNCVYSARGLAIIDTRDGTVPSVFAFSKPI